MKYLKKRASRKHTRRHKKLKKRRCKTVRRRNVMKGGWGLTPSLSAPVFKKIEDDKDDFLVGGNWVTLA